MADIQHHAKKTHKHRKEREHYRNFLGDNATHRHAYGQEYSETKYERSGGPARAKAKKQARIINLAEWQERRKEHVAQDRFARTQARTALRLMAAEPIYPLR
ncbi:MAG: hypothetical protein FIB06_04555 [Betaproteobacteria bacterium]|nr:hypothetical protein [Betaproteobacteria bacterium]